MERTLERAFFKEYQGDGAGMLSLKMALFKYSGIGSNVPARPDYPDGVIAEILARTGAIEEWPNNLDGCTCALFDEIGDNLDSLPSVEAMKRYAIEVISKFRDYAFHYRLGITGLNTISNTISSLKSIEYLFLQWHGAFITFTEGFAAILLKRGLNLIELQNQCGVTLIERLNPNRLLMFIGNDSEVERLLRKVNLSEGDNLNLPETLDNDRARKYFIKAIKEGWMEKTATGFKWLFGNRKGKTSVARLGYFLQKVYCPTNTEQFPATELSRLFGGTSRLDSANYQIDSAKKPQQWRAVIDRLFEK